MTIETIIAGGLLVALATVVAAIIAARATRSSAVDARVAVESAAVIGEWEKIVAALQSEVRRMSDDLAVVRLELVSCRQENETQQARMRALSNRLERAAVQLRESSQDDD